MIEAARAGHPPRDPGLLAHLVLRLAFAAEPAARVRALADRATAADPLVDPASLGILNGLIVQALCCVDELDAAERISDAALAAARRRGSLLNFTMASYHRAIGRYHRGELSSALADLDQARIAAREGWTAGDVWPGGLRVHIHVRARRPRRRAATALALTARARGPGLDGPSHRPVRAAASWRWPRPARARRCATPRRPGSCSPPASASITRGSCPGSGRPPWPRTRLGDQRPGPGSWRANCSTGPAGRVSPGRFGLALRTQARSAEGKHQPPRLPKRRGARRAVPLPCNVPMRSSSSVPPAVTRASVRPPRRRCARGCS